MKNAAIFVHDSPDDPALFGTILRERGFAVNVIDTRSESVRGFDALAPDLLMVMGGPMGVYEADHHPFLYDEIRVLEKRLGTDRPTLGVCLGAQLIAAALGRKVYKGAQGPEFGWKNLEMTPAGQNHAVRHLAAGKTRMFQSHGDTFDLPANATLLASSAQYPHQIFSHGQNALALQCHPEVDAKIMRGWLPPQEWIAYLSSESGGLWDNDAFRKQTAENLETLNRQARLFLEEWLGSVGL